MAKGKTTIHADLEEHFRTFELPRPRGTVAADFLDAVNKDPKLAQAAFKVLHAPNAAPSFPTRARRLGELARRHDLPLDALDSAELVALFDRFTDGVSRTDAPLVPPVTDPGTLPGGGGVIWAS
jgi:hypothetical protein